MKKLTTKEFIERGINVHGNEYDYSLVDYKNTKTKIKIICLKHGIFEQIPNNHLNGMGCPICGKLLNDNNKNKDTNYFINCAIKIHGNKYNYSDVIYNGALNYVKIICPTHGSFSQIASSHLSGRGCSKCVGGISKTLSEFINDAKRIHENKYNYSLVKYINSHTKVNIICSKHGIFKQTPTNHLRGQGCPVCNESKGEKEIAKYLNKNLIPFEREKKFSNCKGRKRALSFDFYISSKNILIEFDGRQHYEKVNFNGCSDKMALELFSELKKNDKIKNKFTKDHNYNLLRINYKKINIIDEILDKYEPLSQRQAI